MVVEIRVAETQRVVRPQLPIHPRADCSALLRSRHEVPVVHDRIPRRRGSKRKSVQNAVVVYLSALEINEKAGVLVHRTADVSPKFWVRKSGVTLRKGLREFNTPSLTV